MPLGFQIHRCSSAGIDFLFKDPGAESWVPPLVSLHLPIQPIPLVEWRAGDHILGVEAQRVATVSRATDKDQGQSSPTHGKGSVLLPFPAC